MTTTTQALSPKQLVDLKAYAEFYGNGWKAKLEREWRLGFMFGDLQVLRTTHGPSWLAKFKF